MFFFTIYDFLPAVWACVDAVWSTDGGRIGSVRVMRELQQTVILRSVQAFSCARA